MASTLYRLSSPIDERPASSTCGEYVRGGWHILVLCGDQI